MKCSDCTKADKESDKDMAKLGYGRCKEDERSSYYSTASERDCKDFTDKEVKNDPQNILR